MLRLSRHAFKTTKSADAKLQHAQSKHVRSKIKHQKEILENIKKHQSPELTRQLEEAKGSFVKGIIEAKQKMWRDPDYYKRTGWFS